MDNKINIKFSGLLPTLLTILFIGLKLTNHINWSWWWVLSPLWIPLSLGLLFIITLFLCWCITK